MRDRGGKRMGKITDQGKKLVRRRRWRWWCRKIRTQRRKFNVHLFNRPYRFISHHLHLGQKRGHGLFKDRAIVFGIQVDAGGDLPAPDVHFIDVLSHGFQRDFGRQINGVQIIGQFQQIRGFVLKMHHNVLQQRRPTVCSGLGQFHQTGQLDALRPAFAGPVVERVADFQHNAQQPHKFVASRQITARRLNLARGHHDGAVQFRRRQLKNHGLQPIDQVGHRGQGFDVLFHFAQPVLVTLPSRQQGHFFFGGDVQQQCLQPVEANGGRFQMQDRPRNLFHGTFAVLRQFPQHDVDVLASFAIGDQNNGAFPIVFLFFGALLFLAFAFVFFKFIFQI